MNYVVSPSFDPFWNLGLEDWILRHLPQKPLLLLWRSLPCVVMGRFQNPWMETSLSHLLENATLLARRQSGGGCVFLDENNVNLTFFCGPGEREWEKNLLFVDDFLRTHGFQTHINKRHDIVVPIRGVAHKISGSAFKQTREGGFHHFTLLVDSDLKNLSLSLKPSLQVKKSRAVGSTPSPVTTLRKVNPLFSWDHFWACFEAFLCGHGLVRRPLPQKICVKKWRELRSWKWVIGETPRFEWIEGSVAFFSHKGYLTGFEVGGKAHSVSIPMDTGMLEDYFKAWGPPGQGNFFQKVGRSLALFPDTEGQHSGQSL